MSSKLSKTIDALRAMLPRCGFKEDAYGHFQRSILDDHGKPKSAIRIKMQQTSVRVEVELGNEWRKADGAYLKDVVIAEDGVTIGKRKYDVK
jgi:hypothetical protein